MVTIQLWLRSYPCTDSYCQRLYWIRHHTRPISLVNTYRRQCWACEPHKKYRNRCHACARGRERGRKRAREASAFGDLLWSHPHKQASGAKQRFTLSVVEHTTVGEPMCISMCKTMAWLLAQQRQESLQTATLPALLPV